MEAELVVEVADVPENQLATLVFIRSVIGLPKISKLVATGQLQAGQTRT